MDVRAAMLLTLIILVFAGCLIVLLYRLRRLGAQRQDAEQRAMAAFEEMNRLTRELRERDGGAPADPAITPGLRLQQLYPGPRPAPVEEH